MLDAIFLQILNGLDKGSAYALIALGLTLVFGTLGVVNFAHGALFMLGAFCAVAFQQLLTLSTKVKDPGVTFFDAFKEEPYLKAWLGDAGQTIIDYSVPLSIILTVPVMLLIGLVLERGLSAFSTSDRTPSRSSSPSGSPSSCRRSSRPSSAPIRFLSRRRRRLPALPISASGSASAPASSIRGGGSSISGFQSY